MLHPIENIILCGKSFIGCWALQYLLDLQKISGQLEISVVPNQEDKGVDTWQPSLTRLAKNHKVRILKNIIDGRTAPHGIILSLEYDKIIRQSEIGNWQAYNIHFSALPAYRGCLTSVWPLRNGETNSGVTLHVVTPRIDGGPIIDQILFAIEPFLTSRDLYQLYQTNGFVLFKKNINRLLSGKAIRGRVQSETEASYYSRSSVNFRDRTITNFQLPSRVVVNYIRSLIFKPYQLPLFQSKKIIYCDIVSPGRNQAKVNPGRVIHRDTTHAIISCLDGYIRLFFDET